MMSGRHPGPPRRIRKEDRFPSFQEDLEATMNEVVSTWRRTRLPRREDRVPVDHDLDEFSDESSISSCSSSGSDDDGSASSDDDEDSMTSGAFLTSDGGTTDGGDYTTDGGDYTTDGGDYTTDDDDDESHLYDGTQEDRSAGGYHEKVPSTVAAPTTRRAVSVDDEDDLLLNLSPHMFGRAGSSFFSGLSGTADRDSHAGMSPKSQATASTANDSDVDDDEVSNVEVEFNSTRTTIVRCDGGDESVVDADSAPPAKLKSRSSFARTLSKKALSFRRTLSSQSSSSSQNGKSDPPGFQPVASSRKHPASSSRSTASSKFSTPTIPEIPPTKTKRPSSKTKTKTADQTKTKPKTSSKSRNGAPTANKVAKSSAKASGDTPTTASAPAKTPSKSAPTKTASSTAKTAARGKPTGSRTSKPETPAAASNDDEETSRSRRNRQKYKALLRSRSAAPATIPESRLDREDHRVSSKRERRFVNARTRKSQNRRVADQMEDEYTTVLMARLPSEQFSEPAFGPVDENRIWI